MIATGLREVAAGDDSELEGKRLQEDRHQIRNHDDGEERVVVLRSAGEIRRPVARVHVADRDQESWARESEELAEETSGRRDYEASMDFGQAHSHRLRVETCVAVERASFHRIRHD